MKPPEADRAPMTSWHQLEAVLGFLVNLRGTGRESFKCKQRCMNEGRRSCWAKNWRWVVERPLTRSVQYCSAWLRCSTSSYSLRRKRGRHMRWTLLPSSSMSKYFSICLSKLLTKLLSVFTSGSRRGRRVWVKWPSPQLSRCLWLLMITTLSSLWSRDRIRRPKRW